MGNYYNLLRTPSFLPDGIQDDENQLPDLPSPEDNSPMSFAPPPSTSPQSYQSIQMPYMNAPDPLAETHKYEDLIRQRMDHQPAPLWKQILGGVVGAYVPRAGQAIANPGGYDFNRKLKMQGELSKEEMAALQKQAQYENIQSQIANRGASNAQRDLANEARINSARLAQQKEIDDFEQRGGEFVSPQDRQQAIQPEPLQSPEQPGPMPENAQGPMLPTPNELLPLSRRPQLPVTAQIPAIPEGYQQTPGAAPTGQIRIAPTAAERDRQKKAADQENWPTITPQLVDTLPELGLTPGSRVPKETYNEYLKMATEKAKNPKLTILHNVNEANGDVTVTAVDPATGKLVTTFTQSGIGQKRPPSDAGAAAALDRETARFAKPHEKSVADATSQLEKIADARAMINGSAEAQALGVPKILTALVSGQGSGVRITQAELNAIAHARGIAGDVKGFFSSISGQGKLTAAQQQQMTQLLDDVRDRVIQKQAIANDALDAINAAPSREEVIRIDRETRKKLADMDKGGAGSTKAVNMKAPDGTVKSVSADQVEHYKTLGAVVVP